MLVGKPAHGLVQLIRGNAQIQQNAVYLPNAVGMEYLRHVEKIFVDGHKPIRQAALCHQERVFVSVYPDQNAVGAYTL